MKHHHLKAKDGPTFLHFEGRGYESDPPELSEGFFNPLVGGHLILEGVTYSSQKVHKELPGKG